MDINPGRSSTGEGDEDDLGVGSRWHMGDLK